MFSDTIQHNRLVGMRHNGQDERVIGRERIVCNQDTHLFKGDVIGRIVVSVVLRMKCNDWMVLFIGIHMDF